MADKKQTASNSVKSTSSNAVQCMIGSGVTLRGDMDFNGGMHVDGDITGDLQGQGKHSRLTLSRDGNVNGNIHVGDAEINGTVIGDVHASGTVTLHPQSIVNGDVYYGKIQILNGARINGKLIANNPQSDKNGLLGKLARKSA